MEVSETLRGPLAPKHVREALSDLTLLRASLDNCELFTRTPNGECVLTLTVRARYDIRVHAEGHTRQAAAFCEPHNPVYTRTLSFKVRGDGVGSVARADLGGTES